MPRSKPGRGNRETIECRTDSIRGVFLGTLIEGGNIQCLERRYYRHYRLQPSCHHHSGSRWYGISEQRHRERRRTLGRVESVNRNVGSGRRRFLGAPIHATWSVASGNRRNERGPFRRADSDPEERMIEHIVTGWTVGPLAAAAISFLLTKAI